MDCAEALTATTNFVSTALMYNAVNGSIGRARGHYDPLNSVLAGGLTGAIFKSTGKEGHSRRIRRDGPKRLIEVQFTNAFYARLAFILMIAGLRAAGSAGGVCAVAAGIWAYGKEALNL